MMKTFFVLLKPVALDGWDGEIGMMAPIHCTF